MADLPADMVEAAARALHEDVTAFADWTSFADWDTEDEQVRAQCRDMARAFLAAALATGVITDEWRVVGISGTFDTLESARANATYYETGRILPRIDHRTVHSLPSGHVLTSPWVEVSD